MKKSILIFVKIIFKIHKEKKNRKIWKEKSGDTYLNDKFTKNNANEK